MTFFCDYGHDLNSNWTIDLQTKSTLRIADFINVLAIIVGKAVDVES